MTHSVRGNSIKISDLQAVFAVIIVVLIVFAMFYSHKPPTLAAGTYVIDHPMTQSFTYQHSPLESISLSEIFWLFILGFLSGIVGGMLGMGGGLLKVSGMFLFFGYEVILARVVSLITYSGIAITAFFKYRNFNFIMWDVVKILATSAIVGVIAGVFLGNIINSVWIEKLLGIYAIFIAVILMLQIYKTGRVRTSSTWKYKPSFANKLSFIGILKGFSCGLFGISGGIISVPLQQLMLKIPVKNSIANSLTSAMFSATFAAFLALTTGIASGFFKLSLPLILALPLIPGTIIGARIGANITKKLDPFYIKICFAIVALIMGLRILFFH